MIETWVFRENLDAFLRLDAKIAEYDYSLDDRAAFDVAIVSTDSENDNWLTYEFSTPSCCIPFSCAIDPGTSVVHFRIDGPSHVTPQIQLAVIACTEFNIVYRHG
jgi:hypothetical protein